MSMMDRVCKFCGEAFKASLSCADNCWGFCSDKCERKYKRDSQPIPFAPVPPPKKIYGTTLELPQNKPVYKLSESQAGKLLYACAMGGVAWNVPQPKDGDPLDLIKALDELNVEFEDLQALGLAKDISEYVAQKIDHMLKVYGRHVRYFAPTEMAVAMFAKGESRPAH